MVQANIINRRDLEPMWLRAVEIARHYERAVNCISAVMGADYQSVELSEHSKAALFCSFCSKFQGPLAEKAVDNGVVNCPCSQMHRDAAKKAREVGGSYIYRCPAGFFFWTSPFFAGERFAGAIISGAVPENERQDTLDKLFTMYKGHISRDEIARFIDQVPAKTNEEVQALAQTLQLCTRRISSGETCNFGKDCNGINCLTQGGPIDLHDKERLLLANLRRGDFTEAQKTTSEILKDLNTMSNGNFELFKYKVMELVVLLSRSGADSQNDEDITGANSRFLSKIDDSKTAKEVTENLYLIIEQIAGTLFSFRGIRHSSALRKAERFIWENYTKKISLKDVAAASGLSASYFSTIFKNEMGENFSNFLNRLRVEKAALMLRQTESSIKVISAECGFVDQSWFSKIFKNYTGISPCKFRETSGSLSQGFRSSEEETK